MFQNVMRTLIIQLNNIGISSGTIIMDNASIHKKVDLEMFLRRNIFVLEFLPAYSPQLNPIEEVFSKWKHNIKVMNPSCHNDLIYAINNAANSISREYCLSFYAHVRSYMLKGIRSEDF
jgi:transposase